MSGRLAAVDSGSAPHRRSLTEAKYARYWHRTIYLPDLADADLSDVDTLVLPERLHRGALNASRSTLLEMLSRGGEVVLLGDQAAVGACPDGWLPGVRFEHRPTNFWWWLDPDAEPPVVAAAPDHPLFDFLTLEDATWHHHGVLHPPDGAEVVIGARDGSAILYVDDRSSAGRLIVTTLDPMWHFGSYFMPATERFLDGFLPWLAGTRR